MDGIIRSAVMIYILLFLYYIENLIALKISPFTYDITDINDDKICPKLYQPVCIYHQEEKRLPNCRISDQDQDFSTTCSLMEVSLGSKDDLKTDVLEKIFDVADAKHDIRRLRISGGGNFTSKYSVLGALIDKVIVKRPQWECMVEPSEWSKDSSGGDVWVFEKYHKIFDGLFELIASVQYPPVDVCRKTVMNIGRGSCLHPGFSGQLGLFTYLREIAFYQINMVYIPRGMYPMLGFISPTDVFTDNVWESAFLPLTNCSVPAYAVACMDSQCRNEQDNSIGGGTLARCADTSCAMLPKSEVNETLFHSMQEPISKHQVKVLDKYQKIQGVSRTVWNSWNFLHARPFALPSSSSSFVGNEQLALGVSALLTLLNWRFMTRPSAFYRSRIAQMLHEYRQETQPYVLPEGVPCTAVHFRKGDRRIRNVDMIEYCHNLTRARDGEDGVECYDPDTQKMGPCMSWDDAEDLECNSFPFGALELKHAIDNIEPLVGPEKKNILILTDEIGWLNDHIASQEGSGVLKGYKIYMFPNPADAGSTVKNRGGTAQAVHYFASMRLVQQCESFMGHFASGATYNFYASMCVEHNGMRGVCPPSFDFRRLADTQK